MKALNRIDNVIQLSLSSTNPTGDSSGTFKLVVVVAFGGWPIESPSDFSGRALTASVATGSCCLAGFVVVHQDRSHECFHVERKARRQLPPEMAREIDQFEAQMILRKANKIEDRVFAETRLRRGTYGQRYDNGRRHDGIQTQQLQFPNDPMTKGPETVWDAPGMQRIKIPFGAMTPAQMRVLADCAEEYSDSICHVTTRQDIQLHYIHIEDAPEMFRRLASAGITTAKRAATRCAMSPPALSRACAILRRLTFHPMRRRARGICWAIRIRRILAANSRSLSPAAATKRAGW